MSEAASYPRATVAVAGAGCAVCFAWFGLVVDARLFEPLSVVLVFAALAANLSSAFYQGAVWISASCTCSIVAFALLGPAAAFAVVALAEVGAWAFERYRPASVLVNLL